MSRSCLPCSSRAGLTLIEVTAGIGLMATLLVGILLAFRGSARQIAAAEQRLAAIEAADGLLTQWVGQEKMPKVGAHGECPGRNAPFHWRMAEGSSPERDGLSIKTMRLEISDAQQGEAPLAAVEWVVSMIDRPST